MRAERVIVAQELEARMTSLEALARRFGLSALAAKAGELKALAVRLQSEEGTGEALAAEAERIGAAMRAATQKDRT